MSTKIYTGFKFKDNDLIKIHKHIMDFRQKADKIAKEELAKWYAKRISNVFDSLTLNKNFTNEYMDNLKKYGILSTVHFELCERHREIERTKQRDPEIDFSFVLSILPLKNKILGIYYGENEKIINAWMNSDFVLEYHYQNQSDRPKDISYEEWRQRKRDWDKALEYDVPCMRGFMADIITKTNYLYIEEDEIIKYIPKFDERAIFFAKENLFYKKLHEHSQTTTFNLFRNYSKTKEWMKTKQGKKSLNNEIKKVKSKLKKRIYKHDISIRCS